MRYWHYCSAAVLAAALFELARPAQAVTAADVAARLRQKIVGNWEVENLEISVVPYSQAHSDRGHFKSVTVRADKADIKGIVVRPVYVKGLDVVFDLRRMFGPEFSIQTLSRGHTEMYLVLYEADLNEGLRRVQKVVPDLKATLSDGQITLTGTYKFVIGNKFRMSGKLVAPDGYKINFVPTAAKVNGVPIPVSGVKILVSKLNPILDLSEVIMQPRITSLVIEQGKLIAR